ncbi:MAG TPA: hypothetical protein VKR58_01155 [Aquella sp.]|nr:hypothetical protein [Aquella sp.]
MKQRKYLLNLFITLFLCFSIAQAEEQHGRCFYFDLSDNADVSDNANGPEYIVNWYSTNIDDNTLNVKLMKVSDLKPVLPILSFKGISTFSNIEGKKTIEVKVPEKNLTIKIEYTADSKFGEHLGKISYPDIKNDNALNAMCFIANSKEELDKMIVNSKKNPTLCERYSKTIAGIAAGAAALLVAYYCGT